jgi:hypothetical protein
MWEIRNEYNILVRKPEGTRHRYGITSRRLLREEGYSSIILDLGNRWR